MNKTILIVDDDIELCKLLRQCLGKEGFEIHSLHQGGEVLPFLTDHLVDLIILDVMLPEIDGFTLLKEIRKQSNIPILMLSAKGEEMNKVMGLTMGADDYLTKPFGLSELIARVENLFRRCGTAKQPNQKNTVLVFDTLEIDTEKCLVRKDGVPLTLTSKEYKLLVFFAENPAKVFTKKQIYNNVWEEDFMYDDNTIMALISRLRKKIEDHPEAPAYIMTVRGIGYRFRSEEK